MMTFLPKTTSRVTQNTARRVNERIRRQTEENVKRYCGADSETISRRLEELDREWDVERLIETGVAINVLVGVTLGTFVNRRWIAWCGIAGGLLLIHALQGWFPPLPILRRVGFRTEAEIEEERDSLRLLRGDFNATDDPIQALAQARLSLAPSMTGESMESSR